MNQLQYLSRLNITHDQPSLENLSVLQTQHLQTIAFENLDVIRKVPIYLNLDNIYKKIVEQQRGGYCYELNGLFHSLLVALGYDAYLVSATVLRPNNEWAKADTHAAMIVHLDQPYLVDVGFGAATPRVPVPLTGKVKTTVGETYHIETQPGNVFYLVREADHSPRTLYQFTLQKKNLVDFHEGCVFNQVSKDSTFTHTDILSLATEKGRVTLHDHLFTEVKEDETVKRTLSPEEKKHVLASIFMLSLK